MRARPLRERFNEKWTPEPFSGCWLWTAFTARKGYGRIGSGKSVPLAHRVSWTLHRGPIPEGMHVLHHCDTPSCVNPDHLFLGTDADNHRDSVAKGRRRTFRGEQCACAKLTERDVRFIRESHLTGKVLARQFNITKGHISSIRSGRAWRHLASQPSQKTIEESRKL